MHCRLVASEDGQVSLPDAIENIHELVRKACGRRVQRLVGRTDFVQAAETGARVEEEEPTAQAKRIGLEEDGSNVLHVDVSRHTNVRVKHLEAASCVDGLALPLKPKGSQALTDNGPVKCRAPNHGMKTHFYSLCVEWKQESET